MEPDIYENLLENIYDGVYFVNQSKQITLWNRGAEKITGFTKSEVMGRCCANNILRHINDNGDELCIKGCPLDRTLTDGKIRSTDIYLHHKEGHRLPVSVRVSPIKDKNNMIIGAIEIFSDNSKHQNLIDEIGELNRQVLIDDLTNLGNRKMATLQLTNRLNDMATHGIPFGVIFFDIDQFKKINDTWGHHVGDKILIMVSKTITNIVRSLDAVCRLGGDEFLIIMPNVDINALRIIGEKARIFIEKTWLELDGNIITTTISVGGIMANPKDNVESLIKKSDEQMYHSKKLGRNAISIL